MTTLNNASAQWLLIFLWTSFLRMWTMFFVDIKTRASFFKVSQALQNTNQRHFFDKMKNSEIVIYIYIYIATSTYYLLFPFVIIIILLLYLLLLLLLLSLFLLLLLSLYTFVIIIVFINVITTNTFTIAPGQAFFESEYPFN